MKPQRLTTYLIAGRNLFAIIVGVLGTRALSTKQGRGSCHIFIKP